MTIKQQMMYDIATTVANTILDYNIKRYDSVTLSTATSAQQAYDFAEFLVDKLLNNDYDNNVKQFK